VENLVEPSGLDEVVREPRTQRLLAIGDQRTLERGTAEVRLDRDDALADLGARERKLRDRRGLALALAGARDRNRAQPSLAAARELEVRAQQPVRLAERRDRRVRAAATWDACEHGSLELRLDVLRGAQPVVQAVAQEGERDAERQAEDRSDQRVERRLRASRRRRHRGTYRERQVRVRGLVEVFPRVLDEDAGVAVGDLLGALGARVLGVDAQQLGLLDRLERGSAVDRLGVAADAVGDEPRDVRAVDDVRVRARERLAGLDGVEGRLVGGQGDEQRRVRRIHLRQRFRDDRRADDEDEEHRGNQAFAAHDDRQRGVVRHGQIVSSAIGRVVGKLVGVAVIDLHSHILPGLDDGAPDLDMSLRMAAVAVEDGVDTIVATPHVSHTFTVAPLTMAQAVGKLNIALSRMHSPLAVLPGAEIAVESIGELDDTTLRQLTLGGSTCLLVEPPYRGSVPFLESLMFDLQVRGFRPMLAHPERALAFRERPHRLGELTKLGVLTCVNAGSMIGRFGAASQELALRFLAEGNVNVIASDSHDDEARPPALRAMFEQADELLPGIADHRTLFTETAPAAVLASAPMPKRPQLGEPPRPTRWQRLRGGLRPGTP
jgi:protein-tyrosine phosphatase